jgi:hypothetical protein
MTAVTSSMLVGRITVTGVALWLPAQLRQVAVVEAIQTSG